MPLKTLGPIGPRAAGEKVKKKFSSINFSTAQKNVKQLFLL